MKGRLIINKQPQNAFYNMATDFALLSTCKAPTLRLYSWKPKAVSIGRFQSLKDEVDIEYCKKRGINYVRRITGGGAVFHDDELTYSFCIPVQNQFFSDDLQESYRFISKGVIKGLANIKIKADYKPINDLVVGNKKISGCAQTRKDKNILQHGTILLGLNVEEMFRALKVSKEKISDKQIADAKQRVTSVRDELGNEASTDEAIKAIVQGFTETFKINFELDNLKLEEEKLRDKYEKEIFANKNFIYER